MPNRNKNSETESFNFPHRVIRNKSLRNFVANNGKHFSENFLKIYQRLVTLKESRNSGELL